MPEPRVFKFQEPEERRTGYEHLNEFQGNMKAACQYIHARVRYTLTHRPTPLRNTTGLFELPENREKA